MKKGKHTFFKKVIYLVLIIYIAITSFSIAYGTEMFFDTREQGKQYKKRSISVSGFEDVILSFSDEMYFDAENYKTTAEEKKNNNYLIIGVCGFLVVYWVGLLIICEKEELYDYTYNNSDDIETLRKYNPLIAGCIVDNRQVLPRDIMSVILGLIQRGYIDMEMIPNKELGEDNYIYMISESKKNKGDLDKVECYIMSWIFGYYEEEKVDLIRKLKDITKRKDFLKKMNELNHIAEEELNSKGANIQKVPKFIRGLNVFLLIAVVFISAVHIITNGISIQIYESTVLLFILTLAAVIFIIPVVALIIHLALMFIIWLKKVIKNTSEIYSGKKIIEMSAITFFFVFLLIVIVYFIVPNKYICLDIFMIGMALLIVKTDNLMTKHNKEILNDYYALNEIKYRIEEYSLIKDEQINYMKLWDDYLIYAVAFGIPVPIVKKLRNTHKEDEDLRYLSKCEGLYYISKAYLEVMWEMEFKKAKEPKILKKMIIISFKKQV